MSSRPLDEERIFHLARAIPAGPTRDEYLVQICAGDVSLRERVDELLRIYTDEHPFLKTNDGAVPETMASSSGDARPGSMIGRYKLMEQIGEGGMGAVFVAQQDRPIRRKVALKVIKPGMDSKAVVARFEAERQALALMDHANIAKVLDAGTTDFGRPYFVMELVKGVPITEYCDRNRLSVDERLELFIEVCSAIQHAHQKGIIHRDIKPSNILVTLQDGTPIPKVIDFGVAKAVNARLTDKTIYTEHFQVVGTLLYMSPEQAEFSGLDVDTRSDIYSLGVLLYELLTGTTPFQKHELVKAGLDEQRRMIRECEPPRASIRISTLGETATAVADARKTDAKRLKERVQGDLDWVVLKSVDKDRTRRYESAAGFGRDVARYLANEAVLAHPPSTAYRVRKFASKNRAAFVTLSGVVLALALGMGVAIWQRQEAIAKTRALEVVQQERVKVTTKLEESAIESAWTAAWFGDRQRVDDALAGVRENHSYNQEILRIEGLLLYTQGHLEPARERFESALKLDEVDYFSQAFLATTAINAGEYARFASECEKLDAMRPKNAYDRLALASVEVFRDPFRALQIVEEVGSGVRGIGKLFVRTEANVHAAYDSGSLEYCDTGLEDIERVELLLGRSSNTLCVRLLNLTYGAYVAESKGDVERAKNYAERAKKANQELIEAGYDDSLAHSIQWHYYQYGPEPDPELAWRAVKQVKVDADYVINIAVDRMINEADPRQALRDYDELVGGKSTLYARFARALLMCSLPDKRAEVSQIAKDLSEQESAVFKRCALFLYALLGDTEAAERVAKEALRIHESRSINRELQSIKAFANPEDFEGFAKLGDRQRLDFTLSELTRGLLAISRGNGANALEAFESARKSQLKIYYLDMYAAAFAHQLKTNPSWPCGRSINSRVQLTTEESEDTK